MPAGIPVAAMAIGSAGARNAVILAAQILALQDPDLRQQLHAYKKALADEVDAASRKLQEKIAALAAD